MSKKHKKHEKLAVRDVEGDIVECRQIAVALRDTFDLETGHALRPPG